MDPLDIIRDRDIKLYNLIKEMESTSMGEGSIPTKYKILMILALDASHGAVNGVKALYGAAKAIGVTDDEINDAIRVATFVSGAAAAYTVADALSE